MKFLVLVSLALFMQIHQTLQAPANKNHENYMLFRVKNFEEDSEEVVVGEFEGDETNKQPSENANLILIDKIDLMNLVANENAAIDTLESILDNQPSKRYKRDNASWGRQLSNNLDRNYNGQGWYEKAVRPALHAATHNSFGHWKSLDNGRKYIGSFITGKNPNYHDAQREYDRAKVHVGRYGVGRRPEDIIYPSSD